MIRMGTLSDETRAQIRHRSKALFGNLDRLEVAVAVAQARDGAVNATEIGWDLRLPANRVRAQLEAFAALGFLADSPTVGGKRWFIRVENPFWTMCVDLYDEWSR